LKHFNKLLNRPSLVNQSAIDEMSQFPTKEDLSLSLTPSLAETTKAIKWISNGKEPGADGIPKAVFKNGSQNLVRQLVQLLKTTWEMELVSQDFKDANIIHLYKNKCDRSSCDKQCDNSLLATVGKVLAKIIANRLSEPFRVTNGTKQ